jgi:hypothetical protein
MLNKLEEMKGPTSIYTPLGGSFQEASICASNKKTS